MFGPDLDQLRELGNQVRRVLSETPDVVHVTTDLDQTLPTLSIDVDEEQARIAGLTHTQIARQLEASLEGAVGGSVLEATEELPVRIRCGDDVRSGLDQIASLELLSQADPQGRRRAIPVFAVADIRLQSKVSPIRRFDTQRINEVRAYITAGKLPADVLADFRDRFQTATKAIQGAVQPA